MEHRWRESAESKMRQTASAVAPAQEAPEMGTSLSRRNATRTHHRSKSHTVLGGQSVQDTEPTHRMIPYNDNYRALSTRQLVEFAIGCKWALGLKCIRYNSLTMITTARRRLCRSVSLPPWVSVSAAVCGTVGEQCACVRLVTRCKCSLDTHTQHTKTTNDTIKLN